MRFRRVVFFVSIAALGPAACSSCEDEEIEIAQPPDPRAGCTKTTFTAIRRTGVSTCPLPNAADPLAGSWAVRDPFLSPAPVGFRSVELCSYRWIEGDAPRPPAAEIDALRELANKPNSPLTRLDESCAVVVPLADTIMTTLLPNTRAAFRAQVDQQRTLAQGTDRPAQIRVAVVDTLPDSDPPLEAFRIEHVHGRTVALVIKELACPTPATCPLHLTSHLAFGRPPSAHFPAQETGATLGTQDDLTFGISQALNNWLSTPDVDREPRLVINLSLGWSESIAATTSTTTMHVPSYAVWRSIAEATCRGALVVVAAGNATNGAVPGTGPMFPAAWEMRRALTDDQCEKELGFRPAPGVRTAQGTFLLSAGGLDGLDRPVSNVRRGGRPRIGASAEHVGVAETTSSGEFASVMTGSSMSAAVTSAAAAVAWSYQPNATSAEVADLLYKASVPLANEAADYCLGGTSGCGDVRRVSICGVLHEACRSGSGGAINLRCPSSVGCAVRPAFNNNQIRVSATEKAALASLPTFAAPSGAWIAASIPACGSTVLSPPSSLAEPCPSRQFYNATGAPAVYPQPEVDPCPLCFLNKVQDPVALCHTLYVTISRDFPSGTTIGNASINLTYPDGSSKIYDASALSPLAPGGEGKMCVPIGDSSFVRGTISFLIQQPGGAKYSSESPLAID